MSEEDVLGTALGTLLGTLDFVNTGDIMQTLRDRGYNWTEANTLRNLMLVFGGKRVVSGTVSLEASNVNSPGL